MKKIIRSLTETQQLAKDIANQLQPGALLCLYGDLGAGKTAFTKALGQALGVKETIISPTFVLMTEYPAQLADGTSVTLYHLDAYRLDSVDEALDLGLEDIWARSDQIMVIEWADRIADILPEKRTDIYFRHVAGDAREVTVKMPNAKHEVPNKQ